MSDVAKSGRELTSDLIWARRVCICSNMRSEFQITRRRCSFAEQTADSHFPPRWGACGGIKLVFILSLANAWDTWVLYYCDRMSLYKSSNTFFAPTKLRRLSLKTWLLLPRREINRRSAARNISVLRSVANSTWIAEVTRQTNRQMYPYSFRGFCPLCTLAKSGPA